VLNKQGYGQELPARVLQWRVFRHLEEFCFVSCVWRSWCTPRACMRRAAASTARRTCTRPRCTTRTRPCCTAACPRVYRSRRRRRRRQWRSERRTRRISGGVARCRRRCESLRSPRLITMQALNVTQRALSVTQRALSVTQRALSVTQRALSVTQRALSITQRATQKS
jgi:hypothetical protein